MSTHTILLIYPDRQTITEHIVGVLPDGTLDDSAILHIAREHIRCDFIDMARCHVLGTDQYVAVFVDDQGIYKQLRPWGIQTYGHPFFGRGVVIGTKIGSPDSWPCGVTPDQLRASITWVGPRIEVH